MCRHYLRCVQLCCRGAQPSLGVEHKAPWSLTCRESVRVAEMQQGRSSSSSMPQQQMGPSALDAQAIHGLLHAAAPLQQRQPSVAQGSAHRTPWRGPFAWAAGKAWLWGSACGLINAQKRSAQPARCVQPCPAQIYTCGAQMCTCGALHKCPLAEPALHKCTLAELLQRTHPLRGSAWQHCRPSGALCRALGALTHALCRNVGSSVRTRHWLPTCARICQRLWHTCPLTHSCAAAAAAAWSAQAALGALGQAGCELCRRLHAGVQARQHQADAGCLPPDPRWPQAREQASEAVHDLRAFAHAAELQVSGSQGPRGKQDPCS